MPEFLKQYSIDLKNVYSIKNEKLSKLAEEKRKNRSAGFWAFFTILSAILFYLSADGAAFGFSGVLGYLLMAVAASMSCVLFNCAGSSYFLTSVFLPVAGCVVRFVFFRVKGEGFLDFASTMLIAALIILTSCALIILLKNGAGKTVYFAVLSALCVFIVVTIIATGFAFRTGSLSVSSISKGIDGFFESAKETYTQVFLKALDDETAFETALEFLPEEQRKDAQKADILNVVQPEINLVISAVKTVLPGIFAISGMVYGFVAVSIFSVFARHFGLDVFISLSDDKWRYHVSSVTTKLFDILLFAVIIGSFFSLPESITATVINMLLILTPLLFCISVREIFLYFADKGKSKTWCTVVTALIMFAASMILGAWMFFLVASVGIVIIARRENLDRIKVMKIFAEEAGVEFNPREIFPGVFGITPEDMPYPYNSERNDGNGGGTEQESEPDESQQNNGESQDEGVEPRETDSDDSERN